MGVVGGAAGLPPAADGGDRERGGVVVDADIDPAGVGGQVVDAVRDGPVRIRSGEEAVIDHPHRIAVRAPLAPRGGQLAELFLLLRIDADHRLARVLVRLDLLVDVAELHVPVRVLLAFQRLGVGLQAESVVPQQSSHRRCGHRMALPGQLLGQVSQRLGRPPQRRLRIPTLIRLDQRQQRRHQLRIQRVRTLAAPTRTADPTRRCRLLAGLQLEHAPANRGLADADRPGHRPHPAMPQRPGLRRQRQTPLPLVQMRQQYLEPLPQPVLDLAHNRPTASTRLEHKTTLYYLTVT